MKIIIKDNYDREIVSDRLVCDNINEHWGAIIVEKLNECYSCTDLFFSLKPDNYKLYIYNPE